MTNPITYLTEVGREMQRVSWPSARITALHTVIVVVSMVVIIAIVGGIDSLLVKFIQKVLLKG